MDNQYLKMFLISLAAGLLVALDSWANNKIEYPLTEDGEVHKIKAFFIYFTSIALSVIAGMGGGVVAIEYGLGENSSFMMAGLTAILGKDVLTLIITKRLAK
jgi:sorbitol-specific phosphotransferase system component IIC